MKKSKGAKILAVVLLTGALGVTAAAIAPKAARADSIKLDFEDFLIRIGKRRDHHEPPPPPSPPPHHYRPHHEPPPPPPHGRPPVPPRRP
ncbi:MAG: hypothetical protein IJP56_06360 [Synergistaceae bacterium]|nr:hypothetical protein [Synergistaceae bacterium]